MIDKLARHKQLDYEEELVEDANEEGELLLSSSKNDTLSEEGEH
jgi:hypothetical protein